MSSALTGPARQRLVAPLARADDDDAEAIGVDVLRRDARDLGGGHLLDRGAVAIQPVERLAVVLVGHLLAEHFGGGIGVEDERVEDRRPWPASARRRSAAWSSPSSPWPR